MKYVFGFLEVHHLHNGDLLLETLNVLHLALQNPINSSMQALFQALAIVFTARVAFVTLFLALQT